MFVALMLAAVSPYPLLGSVEYEGLSRGDTEAGGVIAD